MGWEEVIKGSFVLDFNGLVDTFRGTKGGNENGIS